MRRFVFVVFIFLVSYPLFSQEIRVVRGKNGEFSKKYQGKSEGNGIFWGMADLPPGRIVTLTRPGMSQNMNIDKNETTHKRTAQIVIVKQISSIGRLRSSEIVLSPRGADFFNIKSEMFLVTDNSSVRWADNIPSVNSEAGKNPSKERFNNPYPDEDSYKGFSDNESEYILEPADKRPPKKGVELKDVVDEFENPPILQKNNQQPYNSPQRIEIDVNVGISNSESTKEITPIPDVPKPDPVKQENLDSQLNSKMVSSMQPGIYIQLGYFAKRDSLLNMLRKVVAKYNVKILPENNGSGKNYRFFIGSFANEDEIPLIREDLYKLGLTEFFVVRR